jgi:hypothetical protein
MALTLAAIRPWIRQSAREAGAIGEYTEAQVDRAFITVGARFCRITRAIRSVSTLAITSATAALPSFPTGFRPEQALSAYLNDDDETTVRIVDPEKLRADRTADDASGVPTELCFDTATAGQVYPTPDAAYTLSLRWWHTFQDGSLWTPGARGAYSSAVTYRVGDVVSVTSGSTTIYVCIQAPALNQAPASSATYWTSLGTGTAASVDPALITCNIPDDWLAELLPKGPPAILQGNDPKHRYATQAWADYLAFENSIKGAGGTGAKSVTRERAW